MSKNPDSKGKRDRRLRGKRWHFVSRIKVGFYLENCRTENKPRMTRHPVTQAHNQIFNIILWSTTSSILLLEYDIWSRARYWILVIKVLSINFSHVNLHFFRPLITVCSEIWHIGTGPSLKKKKYNSPIPWFQRVAYLLDKWTEWKRNAGRWYHW